MPTVLSYCGEPTWVDTREEWRQRTILPGMVVDGWYVSRYPQYVRAPVQIEEWTYDLGRTRFTRILRFEDGILVSITSGGYGGR